jgi:hypothetical protein
MRYAVITPAADLHLRDEPGPSLDLINKAVGEPGFDIVSLRRGSTSARSSTTAATSTPTTTRATSSGR